MVVVAGVDADVAAAESSRAMPTLGSNANEGSTYSYLRITDSIQQAASRPSERREVVSARACEVGREGAAVGASA